MAVIGGERERILFVCTANLDRSPTAEDLYRDDPRYEVASAGLAPYATRRLDREHLLWADRIFVMSEREDGHVTQIRLRFPGVDRPLVDLDVRLSELSAGARRERGLRGHPDLVRRLLDRLEPHLGAPRATMVGTPEG